METGSTSQQQDATRPRASPPALPCLVQLQVSAFSVGIDAINRCDGTVNRGLYSVADRVLRVRADPRPDPSGVRSADFAVDASRGLWARVFSFSSSQPHAPPLPLVVYFHGGGFVVFSARQCYFDRLCRRLCVGVGAVVVSVEYRLAPEHPYPAAYDDAVDTLRFIDANGVPGLSEGVRVDLSSCFPAGESAGGNIIHHAANRWATAAPTPNSVRLAGLISVQPYFGGEERTESELRLDGVAPIVSLRRADFWWRAFLPEGASRDHPAARVTDENAGLAEAFPPAMVLAGRRVRPAAGLAAAEGEGRGGGGVPGGYPRVLPLPEPPRHRRGYRVHEDVRGKEQDVVGGGVRVHLAGTKLIEKGL